MNKAQHKRLEKMEGQLEGDLHKSARLLGERGGLVGGPARDAALSDERKTAIARKAARKRWRA